MTGAGVALVVGADKVVLGIILICIASAIVGSIDLIDVDYLVIDLLLFNFRLNLGGHKRQEIQRRKDGIWAAQSVSLSNF